MTKFVLAAALMVLAGQVQAGDKHEKRGLGGFNWDDRPGAYSLPKRTTVEPLSGGRYGVYRDGYRTHTLEPVPRGYELRERGNSFETTPEFKRKYGK